MISSETDPGKKKPCSHVRRPAARSMSSVKTVVKTKQSALTIHSARKTCWADVRSVKYRTTRLADETIIDIGRRKMLNQISPNEMPPNRWTRDRRNHSFR